MSFSCEKCEKVFYKKYNYLRHIKRKTSCIKPICEKCKKTFDRPYLLKRHLQRKYDCTPPIQININENNSINTTIGDINIKGDNNTINNITNYKITIKNFGCENI